MPKTTTRAGLRYVMSLGLVLALVMILAGFLVRTQGQLPFLQLTGSDLRTILVSTGCSLLATCVWSYLILVYALSESRQEAIFREWGIEAIYATRSEMNVTCNMLMPKAKDVVEVVGFGLRGLRDVHGKTIKSKIPRGLHVRILALSPESQFVRHLEIAEREQHGQVRTAILDMQRWVEDLEPLARSPDQVSLRVYDAPSLDFYFRIDDRLWIGPYMHGRKGAHTCVFEFERGKKGFQYFAEYFDELWNNENFAKNYEPVTA